MKAVPAAVSKLIREKLNPQELIMFNALSRGGAKPISELFQALNKTPGIYDNRQMQQRLGGIVSRLNKHLAPFNYKTVPGEPRGTYRLRSTVPNNGEFSI